MMNKDVFLDLKNHYLKINCLHNIVWNCFLIEVFEDCIKARDKFGKIVYISFKDILSVYDCGVFK